MSDNDHIPLVQRLDYLKDICRDKTVLHLGCTNWPYTKDVLAVGTLLHMELRQIARELTGFDADQEGLDLLAGLGIENLYRANLEHLEEVELDRKFDVIVAGEMIEHLSNPGLFLRGIKRFMRADSTLVITTINAYCGFRLFIYGLRGKGGRAEPVHPDHVAYYSYATIHHMLSRENLVARRFLFYDIGNEHRPHNRFWINFINDLCVRFAPQLADGIIIETSLA
ncbi:MAG TPA: methyltransferase domain-containing protein [Pyrinomonadaceae bacterium]|jgi:SAM-dependent methyltransferase